jgi:hypothetical protein
MLYKVITFIGHLLPILAHLLKHSIPQIIFAILSMFKARLMYQADNMAFFSNRKVFDEL